MNLLCRHQYYTSLINPNLTSTNKHFKILRYYKFSSLTQAFSLYNTTDHTQISIKSVHFATLLQTCTKTQSFKHGLQLHCHVIKAGLDTDRFVGNSLLALYFKLGPDFSETKRVFDNLLFKDVVSWTSMISGYLRVGKPKSSILLFIEMLGFDVDPNAFTISAVIKASSGIGDLKIGRCIHGVVLRRGFDTNNVVASALIDFYGKNNELINARRLFDELIEPDAICWTTVISSFTRNDMYLEALVFFYTMKRDFGLLPDVYTFGSVLTACGNLGRVRQGKQVHAKMITAAISGNIIAESSLVDMYGKCGLVDESQRVFDRMKNKNAVTWCALLGGYCQTGEFDTVIRVFRKMDEIELYSFGTVIRACAGLAAVRQGKEVHCQYLKRGGFDDVIVESALVDLYAKCGCTDFAYRIFTRMRVKNLISWNSMIVGFAQNGRGEEALKVFVEMVKKGFKPDNISFIGVLFACSHTGLVNEGRKHFNSMSVNYGIRAGVEHYSCMVDLLGRAGEIEEAEDLIQKTEFKDDSSLWAALLGACSTSTNSVVAERIAKKMIELDPSYHLSYVLLANVYRSVGRWNDALEIWRVMQERGVGKMPGTSWVETESKLGYSVDMNENNSFKGYMGVTC